MEIWNENKWYNKYIYYKFNFKYGGVIIENNVSVEYKSRLPLWLPILYQKSIKQWILWLWSIDQWNEY